MQVFFPAESSLLFIEFICIQLESLLHAFKTTITPQPACTIRFSLAEHSTEIKQQTLEVADSCITGVNINNQTKREIVMEIEKQSR